MRRSVSTRGTSKNRSNGRWPEGNCWWRRPFRRRTSSGKRTLRARLPADHAAGAGRAAGGGVRRLLDAEPGKILHELRLGELTYFGQRPQSPYYGSADATPLFLILLDEYERWTGDVATVRELEPAARAALQWIERYGDSDGDGFVEYQTRNRETGLENQCWKDS